MRQFDYLLIGGGMTADSAAKGIRLVDPKGSIGMIGDEPDVPYNRPPLSKSLWDGMPVDKIMRATRARRVDLVLGRRAVEIDRARKQVRDDRGELYSFGKLLLATGGRSKRLPGGDSSVVYFRTLADYRRMRAIVRGRQPVVIVGGGLIGAELSAGLRKADVRVELIVDHRGPCAGKLPVELVDRLEFALKDVGVNVRRLGKVQSVTRDGLVSVLKLADGSRMEASNVVVGAGMEPNVELASAVGLQIGGGGGIRVSAQGATKDPNIFAAGDVAEYFCPALDRWLLSEHEEHANYSGISVGRAMAGKPFPYDAVPFFYSEVAGRRFEGVGIIDSSLRTVMDAVPGGSTAIAYYLEDDRVVGVLFWDGHPDIEAALALIESGDRFIGATVLGKLSKQVAN